MNVATNDWVCRVGYPRMTPGFTQSYKHILPCSMYRVAAVTPYREAIILEVIVCGKVLQEEFWAGNFHKVTLTPCLEE